WDSLRFYLNDGKIFAEEGKIPEDNPYFIGEPMGMFPATSLLFAWIILFHGWVAVKLVWVFFLASIYFVTKELCKEFTSEKEDLIADIAPVVAVTLPLTALMVFEFSTYPEIPLTFFLWSSFLFLFRAIRYLNTSYAALSGISLALLTLTKITGLLLAPFIIILCLTLFSSTILRVGLAFTASSLIFAARLVFFRESNYSELIVWITYTILFCLSALYIKKISVRKIDKLKEKIKKTVTIPTALFLPLIFPLVWFLRNREVYGFYTPEYSYFDTYLIPRVKSLFREQFLEKYDWLISFLAIITILLIILLLTVKLVKKTKETRKNNLKRSEEREKTDENRQIFAYPLLKYFKAFKKLPPISTILGIGLILCFLIIDMYVVETYIPDLKTGSFDIKETYYGEQLTIYPFFALIHIFFIQSFGMIYLLPKATGLGKEIKERTVIPTFLLIFFLIHWTFAYQPPAISIRYATPLIIPLSIITAEGLTWLDKSLKTKNSTTTKEEEYKRNGEGENREKKNNNFSWKIFTIYIAFIALTYKFFMENVWNIPKSLIDVDPDKFLRNYPVEITLVFTGILLGILFVLKHEKLVKERRKPVKSLKYFSSLKKKLFSSREKKFAFALLIAFVIMMPHGPLDYHDDHTSEFFEVIDYLKDHAESRETAFMYYNPKLPYHASLKLAEETPFKINYVSSIFAQLRNQEVKYIVVKGPTIHNFEKTNEFRTRSIILNFLGDTRFFQLLHKTTNGEYLIFKLREEAITSQEYANGFTGICGINLQNYDGRRYERAYLPLYVQNMEYPKGYIINENENYDEVHLVIQLCNPSQIQQQSTINITIQIETTLLKKDGEKETSNIQITKTITTASQYYLLRVTEISNIPQQDQNTIAYTQKILKIQAEITSQGDGNTQNNYEHEFISQNPPTITYYYENNAWRFSQDTTTLHLNIIN
ncbi:MAG: ArnT family glycosyltransferase, partial [Asgard group archaeon]